MAGEAPTRRSVGCPNGCRGCTGIAPPRLLAMRSTLEHGRCAFSGRGLRTLLVSPRLCGVDGVKHAHQYSTEGQIDRTVKESKNTVRAITPATIRTPLQ